MSRAAGLEALRERIRRIETPARHGVLPFGTAAIDRALPDGGLALGALHEIAGAGPDEEDGAVAAAFAAGILARLGGVSPTSPRPSPPPGAERETMRRFPSFPSPPFRGEREGPTPPMALGAWEGEAGVARGPVLWCLRRPDLYGPSLAAHGLDPARLVLVAARGDDEILWAVEEGLRAGSAAGRAAGLAAAVGEVGRLPMVAGRRLQLAAERSGVTALLLRRWRSGAEAAAERERPSAALTRWRIAALPSRDMGEPGIGRPRWRVELLRCRGGVPAAWDMEVADAAGHVRLSAELADRPAAASGWRAELGRRRAG
jgi:protein ImuA